MVNRIAPALLAQVGELIAARMGLHFPYARQGDLERGLAGAARELGFEDPPQCVDSILAGPLTNAQLQVLAGHLTIGETYFFRDAQILKAVADIVLPELVRKRRGRDRRLRIWSAASCTGEEAYTLAILLHEHLPDLANWQVTITATDVNPRFLSKAVAGVYREWSFRDAPPRLKARYFTRTPEGDYAVAPEIRKLVTFSYLNLVEDAYPSLLNETNAMDLIFCRNVLMYFTPAQIGKVVRKLNHALVDGGWLVVSPSEASQALFHEFVPVNAPGAILYRKGRAGAPSTPELVGQMRADTTPDSAAPAAALYEAGRYAHAEEILLRGAPERPPAAAEFSLLTRTLANQGRLADAFAACERWIALDKLDPAAHYLRAMVSLERGAPDEARASLQRAIYLCPDFVLAHYALGNLARARGDSAASEKHFANALRLLRAHEPEELLPESDGLTAGRLAEIITASAAVEVLP